MAVAHVLQFKVSLRRVRPPIWRRIVVPADYSFWDLHVAIQNAMGWLDSHLHEFVVEDPYSNGKVRIGYADEDSPEITLPGWEVPVALFLNLICPKAEYHYDFGDGWEHSVVLEQILPDDGKSPLPACKGGKRRCPPEDCGGPFGYENLLEVIQDPTHSEHEEMLAWVGGKFDPGEFDSNEVIFEDPEVRFKEVFSTS